MRRRSQACRVPPLLDRLFSLGFWQQRIGLSSSLLPSSFFPKENRLPVAALAPTRQALHGHCGHYSRNSGFDVRRQAFTRDLDYAPDKIWNETLLSSPGALSCDKETGHLFISDTDHHRVIVVNGDGRVLDCIGSSPGNEDGTFETVQFCYPASTAFDSNQNCLFIADSENHVVRKADLTSRTVVTVSPPAKVEKPSSRWRIFKWLQNMGQSKLHEDEDENEDPKDNEILINPWHLKLSQHGLLHVANERFEDLWVLDPNSGVATKALCEGSEVVFDEFLKNAVDCEDMEDVGVHIVHIMTANEATMIEPSRLLSPMDIVSCVVRLNNRIFLLEPGCQTIYKYNLETERFGPLQLSNLGLLGLPWWWALSSLNHQSNERVNLSKYHVQERESRQHPIQVQPGRILLCIEPILPVGMVWAASLEEKSIWRQAIGSVVELSVFGGSLEKFQISGAQLWVDDLDDIDDPEDTKELKIPEQPGSGFSFYSLLDASLGSGEVWFDAVLYLKHAHPYEQHTRQVHVVNKDQILLKHLNVKVRLEIGNQYAEERTKHIQVQL